MNKRITVAFGDGIGPEIMESTLKIMEAAKAPISYDVIEIGEKLYQKGHSSGIHPDDWKTILNNKFLLKAPITTPQGGGYKSLNVTLRKTLGLYANVRPIKALSPFVKTLHPSLDTVIIRENEEDLYAGIEHRQTREVTQCLKLISKPGCEKIIRYAFEYAKSLGRKKVTCMTKDNIMKLTDGMFHKTFDEISKLYPEIATEHMIIDIGMAKYADTPHNFDVIVTPNLYGDIISDVAAQIAGSVGLAGSANIGQTCSMFEAIHGSAPDIAGKSIANPSGLIMGSVLMLNHLGFSEQAQKIENALLTTIEEGIHTADIYNEQTSKEKVTTQQFTKALIDNIGNTPKKLKPASYKTFKLEENITSESVETKTLDGIDIFIDENNRNPNFLAEKLMAASSTSSLELNMITNRGVKVFPNGNPHTFCTDHWRCRFVFKKDVEVNSTELINLQKLIDNHGLNIIKTENLYSFNDVPGYSLGQGQ